MNKNVKYIQAILNIVVAIVAALFLIFVLPKVIVYFLPFVIGFILSLVANPLVKVLEKRVKIVRKHSSMLIIIAVLSLIVLLCYVVIVKVGGELIGFLDNLPDMYHKTSSDIIKIEDNFQGLIERLPENIRSSVNQFFSQVGDYTGTFVKTLGGPAAEAAGNFAKNIPSVLIYVIMTILSSYFFIAEREQMIVFMKRTLSPAMTENIAMIFHQFKVVIGGYFKAQFKIMGVVAVILLAGFTILGVQYVILLSVLVAFLDFLPFFGTGTVLIPWAIFKLLSSNYKMAVGLLVIYAVSQLIRQVIQPKIVGDMIGLNPLLTLLLMYIGYRIDGVFGMIVAVPIGMVLIMLYQNGIFETLIDSVKLIVTDLNHFRNNKEK